MNREQMIETVLAVLDDYVGQFDGNERNMAEDISDAILARSVESYDRPKARRSDPATAVDAASVIKARSGTQRVRLLEAFGRAEAWGTISDEQAAEAAGVSLRSEYATRCSELRAAGLIEATEHTVVGSSGQARITSRITDQGRSVLLARRLRGDA